MRRRLSPLQRGARFAVNVRAVPTLVLWIDAALSTITQADATERISAISDLSGNGNNGIGAAYYYQKNQQKLIHLLFCSSEKTKINQAF